MSNEIKIVKLNVDENQELALNYGIRSIPSLLIFRGGKEIARTVGLPTEQTYEKFVEPPFQIKEVQSADIRSLEPD